MRSLNDHLEEEVLDYILRDEALPIDLQIKLLQAGFVIDELRQRLLDEYMAKGI